KGENKAMELKVKEAYYLGVLKGVAKPDGKQFLALELEMKNITKEKIPYQIPSFNSHFYVGVNEKGMYPASDATWLAQTPIAPPGEPMIQIEPGQTVRGAMIFLVPDGTIFQESLHYYDTVYGHIGVPLIGPMSQKTLAVTKMPTEQPVNITDAFSMTIKGTSLEPKLDVVQAEDNTTFRVIDAEFKTKVQALLDIEPSQRLLLSHDTAQGPLLTKMSDVTAAIPFGFMKPIMLAPGSNSNVRMAYQVPNALANTKTDIIGDLRDGTLQVPLIKGAAYGTPVNKPKLTGDGMEIRINDLVSLNGIEKFGAEYVLADVTVFDKKDGFGTTGFGEAFALVRDDYTAENTSSEVLVSEIGLGGFGDGSGESEYIIQPDPFGSQLLFSVNEDFAVFDGSSRRGLVLFQIPSDDTEHSWTLQSPFFKALKEPVRTGAYESSGLLVYKTEVEGFNDDFETELSEAIRVAITGYEMTRAASGKSSYVKSVGLSNNEGVKNEIPVPTAIYSGAEKIKNVKSIDDFKDTMKELSWLPSADNPWFYRYSREAVLTQGWGNEWDLVNLAEGLLAKLGYRPVKRIVKLTGAGREKLLKLGEITESNIKEIPALSYVDDDGKSKLFVVPFMTDITKLEGLVFMTAAQEPFNLMQQTATVRVSIKGEPLEKDAASQIGDAADALGGGDGTGTSYEYIELFSKELFLPNLSMDALDIGYINVGKDKGDIYKVGINTPSGFVFGDGYIDDGKYKALSIQIGVTLPGQDLIHETTLKEGQTLKDLIHAIGINLPDLPEDAAKELEKAADKAYKGAKNPNENSAMRWYTRSVLDRFIANQSKFDEKNAKALDVRLGRTNKARSLVVTVGINAKEEKFTTNVDIMQGINDVHNGTNEAQRAYNIGAGLFLSQLEGRVLKAGAKVEIAEIWGKAPEDRTFTLVTSEETKYEALEIMKDSNYPEILLKHLEESEKMFIIPDKPTVIDGEERWVWLEIDPNTYETISVLDTGEHGGMAEYVVNMMPSMEECRDYIAGAFVGITTSVWAVSAFSLELDDYNEILKNAAALVDAIAGYLGFVMQGVDFAKNPSISKTVFELSEGPCKFEMKVNSKLKLSGETGHNFDFVSGFKEGAAFYFKNAKKGK
ncbi:MAG: Mg-chelatase subunit ChlD, partial [Clostridiales bacterium]|nr:Mg-chelatase subunit ChlD [Clostridiales bacterium]